jgi:hypothetical protein
MHRERQPCGFASPLNHASNAHPAERLAALIDEDVGPLGPASLLLPSQQLKAVKLVPLQVMNAVGTALEPADDDGALRQVDVVPTQIAGLVSDSSGKRVKMRSRSTPGRGHGRPADAALA